MAEEVKLSPAQILAEYEALRGQAQAYEQNLNLIASSISEVKSTLESLRELKDVEAGAEILVPMGSGTFIKARLEKLEDVIMGVGADISVKKPIEQALKDLENRVEELERVKKEHSAKYEDILRRLQALAPVVEQILAQAQMAQAQPQQQTR